MTDYPSGDDWRDAHSSEIFIPKATASMGDMVVGIFFVRQFLVHFLGGQPLGQENTVACGYRN